MGNVRVSIRLPKAPKPGPPPPPVHQLASGDTLPTIDLRSLLFAGIPTFDRLTEHDPNLWPVWRITRSDEPAWWIGALSAAAAFAREHNLLDDYRAKLGSISVSEFRVDKSDAEGRSSTSAVWEIVNELLAARLLERGLGWRFDSHEPQGRGTHRGDWQFVSPSGRTVFVEVKSLAEREWVGGGGMRPSFAPKMRSVLKGAYPQLPDDGRATLVVVVGRELTKISFGIMHGDLFQALYGQMQITFNVMPYDPSSVRLAPSFREMFTHGGKHRRLGWVTGLVLTGVDEPALRLYAIHNPFANDSVTMPAEDYAGIERFVVDRDGHGESLPTGRTTPLWERVAPI